MSLLRNTVAGIKPCYEEEKTKAKQRLDNLVKPLGSLGRLEEVAIKLSGISGLVTNATSKKCIVVMCSDNGILEEGVSNCPQNITAYQTINIINEVAGIGVLSKLMNSDLRVIDIGINGNMSHPKLINKKICLGTKNMAKGPAMTRNEAIKSIETGIEIIATLSKEGYTLIATGEMGIGNTSTSSAVLMALTGCSPDIAVGKGSGLTEEGFKAKKKIIQEAIEINSPDKNDPIDILAKVGGFDIGGMTGCFIGAAYYRIPILIDGFISAVAALLAYKISPLILDFIFPSHRSTEPGFDTTMEELNLTPFLNLDMRLGEGTGAALGFNIIDAARNIMVNMATFSETSMADDFLIDVR